MHSPKEMIQPVILAGGAGTRLWPLSRANYPKQIQAFISSHSLLQETLLRIAGLPNTKPPIIIANYEHRFIIAEQLKEIKTNDYLLVLEPMGKNTGPSVVLASLLNAATPDVVLAVFPADHAIDDLEPFHHGITQAAALAQEGHVVLFGITPTLAHTGYGYIKKNRPLKQHPKAFAVDQFTEKPTAELAAHYVLSGDYFWNSGIFIFRSNVFLEEAKKFQPDMLEACHKAYLQAHKDQKNLELDAAAFQECPAISIDYAIMEKTEKAVVLAATFKWSDVGNWEALWKITDKDVDNNVFIGDVVAHDVTNSYIRSNDRLVAAVGLDNVVIVETADAVLVADKSQVENISHIVKHLQSNKRTEQQSHVRHYRPWGYFEILDKGLHFQVKRLNVNPGAKLSLQLHYHRTEHWIVMSGTALVTCDEEKKFLGPNQSTYIPMCSTHRLENPGKVPLNIIEVQSGSYLEEDDIVRLEDTYDRAIPTTEE